MPPIKKIHLKIATILVLKSIMQHLLLNLYSRSTNFTFLKLTYNEKPVFPMAFYARPSVGAGRLFSLPGLHHPTVVLRNVCFVFYGSGTIQHGLLRDFRLQCATKKENQRPGAFRLRRSKIRTSRTNVLIFKKYSVTLIQITKP